MARQSGRQYDVPWDNIMDDRIYNKKGQQSDSEQAGTDIGTFGRRSTNSNRANRNSDYLQLMDYQAGGSRYSLNDPSVAYDNMAYPSQDQFPAGRYKKHRTLSESTSGRCNRPCLIGVVVIVLVTALVAAGVGLYFGVFRHETTQVTPSPTTLKVYATELRLTDLSWSSRLEDPTSPEFVIMKDNVLSDMDKIMRHSSLQTKYQSAEVLGFSSGSIKAKLLLKILTDALSAIDVKTSFVQSYNSIDKVTLKVTKALDTTTLTITVTQNTATSSTTTAPTTTTMPSITTPPTTTTPPITTTVVTHAPPIPTTVKHTTIPPSTTTTPTTTTTTPTTTTPTTTTTTPTTTTPTTTTTTQTTTTTTPTTTTTTPTTTTPTTTTTTQTTKTTTPTTTTTTPTTTTPTTTTTTPTTTTPTTTTTTPTTTTSTTTTPTTTTATTTTTTTTPTTTTTNSPSPVTTAGSTTPSVCRNGTLAIPLLFQCFNFQDFTSLTTDDDKCTYLGTVGNCLEGKLETTYNVTCSYSDQLVIIGSFASIVTSALNFDLITVCNFQKR